MKRNIVNRLFFLVLVLTFANSGNAGIESSYNSENPHFPKFQDTIWDIQLSINLSEGTGAEFDGSFFYITNGLTNLIKKYDTAGNLVETFSIPGVTNLSDIAFDGTYMYGGTGSQVIYQMDFITKTLVNTINSPVNVRHIAYDENNDAFWVGSWGEPLNLVSRSGILLNSFVHNLPFITGTAYDNVSPGGPYLWIFDRGNIIPGPQLIHQFDIPSGSFTGVTHDVLSDVGAGQPNAVAGGLFSTADFIQGTFSLGGILIGAPNILFVYRYEEITSVEKEEKLPTEFSLSQNYPNPFNPTTKISFQIAKYGFTSLKIYDILGNEVSTLVNEELSEGEYEIEFDATELTSGIYFYQLRAGNFIQTKKMILLK